MFTLTIFIGIYSYLVFLIGVFGLLYKQLLLIVSVIYFSAIIIFYRNKLKNSLRLLNVKKIVSAFTDNKLFSFIFLILLVQVLINLIGVFGPEISFDSLWYHLTLPKLYILNHQILYIPGAKMIYSVMPKLTEMLYVGALLLSSEITAKLIHFSFGLLSLIAIYKISRKFISEKYSLISTLIFYSSLVVGWESITAYVDLSRAFFEIMALWGFLNWLEKKSYRWLLTSGLVLGLAITTKLVAFESLIIFLPLFLYEAYLNKTKIIVLTKNYSIFAISAIIVPLPWLIFSFVNTGNPFYPYFSKLVVDSGQTFSFPNLTFILRDFYNLFLNLNDPISPLYLILLPAILITLKKADFRIKLIALYTFLAIVIWYLTQQERGGRFILPYLPAFSILGSYSIYKLKSRGLQIFLIVTVVIVSLSSISYRLLANSKYMPVILRQETVSQFLTKNLNFSFGDFYDTDGYFQKNIKFSDKVLLYGFGKLYYVNFPFIDSSFVKKEDKFNYIAVQNSNIPTRFSDWKQIYYNSLTMVRLYSKEGKTWVY